VSTEGLTDIERYLTDQSVAVQDLKQKKIRNLQGVFVLAHLTEIKQRFKQ
jgi:hypothetical protein